MASLIDWGQSDPDAWLINNGFLGVRDAGYWTSTTFYGTNNSARTYAWYVTARGLLGTASKTDPNSYFFWPVRSSSGPSIRTLTVTKAGTGSGNVTPSPGTLAWNGSSGTATYADGTKVTLTAVPMTGSSFSGWSGACGGTEMTCQFTMSAN
jgi:hypothetical protein